MTSADKFVRPSVCPEAPRRTCAMLTVSSSLQISYAIRKSQPTTGSIFPLSLSIAYLISNCLPADSLCSWSYSIKENQLWIKVIIAEEGARGNEGVYNEGRVIKKFSILFACQKHRRVKRIPWFMIRFLRIFYIHRNSNFGSPCNIWRNILQGVHEKMLFFANSSSPALGFYCCYWVSIRNSK